MLIDCKLDEFKVPGFSGFTPAFGTKKADGQPVTSREANSNIMLSFLRQRPFLVNEDSVTTEMRANCVFNISAAGITLTLGAAAFTGCRAEVFNSSDGNASVVYGENTKTVPAGGSVKFEYNGAWQIALSGGGSLDLPYSSRKAPFLAASDRRVLRLYAGTKIEFGESSYALDSDFDFNAETALDAGALLNGKDYYVFVCRNADDSFVLKTSLEKTAPSGFTPEDAVLIGGFHTLCVNAGTGLTYVLGGATLTHPLDGFAACDILPQSVWCLNHRPYSEPEGMVYIPPLDFWCDIYQQSGSGANTKSVYQGAITRSRQYVDFVEDQFCVKKALLNDEEFASAMLGSNEKTAVLGASEAGATSGGAGGRKDTAQRRMISAWGCEEGCGSLWSWLASTSAAGGSGWTTQSGGKGDYYGSCFVLLAGGDWSNAANCGSRARNANDARASANASVGGRGRSRPMRFSL